MGERILPSMPESFRTNTQKTARPSRIIFYSTARPAPGNVLVRHRTRRGKPVTCPALPAGGFAHPSEGASGQARIPARTLAWKVTREVKEVLPLGRKGTGAPVAAQVDPLHTKPPAYGCLLPHLTGFTGVQLSGTRALPGTPDGGEGGIRTLEALAHLHDFQSCAFDHSATSPGIGSTKTAFWRRGRDSNPRGR